ncbi:MAG: hypothetical protein AAGA61_03595 [Pseudomonadota bacterium]
MAERMKDSEDTALEALLRSEPIPDDGFSQRIVARVRRRIWVRRLALPVAAVAGAAIALPAVRDIAAMITDLATLLPAGWLPLEVALPQASAVLMTAAVAVAALFALPALDD